MNCSYYFSNVLANFFISRFAAHFVTALVISGGAMFFKKFSNLDTHHFFHHFRCGNQTTYRAVVCLIFGITFFQNWDNYSLFQVVQYFNFKHAKHESNKSPWPKISMSIKIIWINASGLMYFKINTFKKRKMSKL